MENKDRNEIVKSRRRRELQKPRGRLEDNIKIYRGIIVCCYGLD